MKLDTGNLIVIIIFKSDDKLTFILTWTAIIFTANVLFSLSRFVTTFEMSH